MYVIEVENPGAFEMKPFLSFWYGAPAPLHATALIRIVKSMPLTETMKLKTSVLKNGFYYRSSGTDDLDDDYHHT